MPRRLAFAFFCTLVAAVAAADTHGAWTATPDGPGEVHLFMTTGGWRQFGQGFSTAALGITDSLMQAATATPVTLKLDREAGTLVLEGTFKNGDGAGQFTFSPNRGYLATLQSLGVPLDLAEGRSETDELFKLAMLDVSTAYVRTMRGLFHDATLREIRKARAVNVTPDYITAMRQLGFEITDLHAAARLDAVAVTADYVRSLRAAGLDVRDAHEASRLRAVNVTPQFIAEMAAAGYANLSARDLIRLAATGVDADFIRKMSRYKQ